MAFDEDYEELDEKKPVKKTGQPSIFDNRKKIDPKVSQKAVEEIVNKSLSYKERAAELSMQFKSCLDDKTISSNKSPVAEDAEKELVSKMIQLSIDINNDENELEGMGSIGWLALLLRVTLMQKTRINDLEFELSIMRDTVNKLNAK